MCVCTRSHTVNMNMERLLTLFKHKIDVRVWDLREMCGSKARFDRPRSVGRARIDVLPPTILGDVHDYVVHHSGGYLRTLPHVPYLSRPLPITDHGSALVLRLQCSNGPVIVQYLYCTDARVPSSACAQTRVLFSSRSYSQ